MPANSTFNVTYTATDSDGNVTSVTLPLRKSGAANATPQLDPISDLWIGDQSVTFTVGLSDKDGNMTISPQTLTISGLPSGSIQGFLYTTPARYEIQVSVPAGIDSGIYHVTIQGKDAVNDRTVAHMRILKAGGSDGGGGPGPSPGTF